MRPDRTDEAAPPDFDGAGGPGGDIPTVSWRGEPLSCEGCTHLALRKAGRSQPGRSCVHDRYARRLLNDPHREVRSRVAWRLEPESLPLLRAASPPAQDAAPALINLHGATHG